jgi:hypothetical protein
LLTSIISTAGTTPGDGLACARCSSDMHPPAGREPFGFSHPE